MADDRRDLRLDALSRWVHAELGMPAAAIEPASADASFRRYFRIRDGGRTFIVMDAPPDKEDLASFLAVADRLLRAHISVPHVLARDLDQGFLLLSDLGSRLYLAELAVPAAVDGLYADALRTLASMQRNVSLQDGELPSYDRERLLAEMRLMPEWFLRSHLKYEPDEAASSVLSAAFDALAAHASAQPQVFVHRDYHSRNLLVCEPGAPGVLDFQDAVCGPLTYDLVSLLKDCYISWPPARVRRWAQDFRELLSAGNLPVGRNSEEFMTWFDWMGVQRHLKVLGIFARLWYRDGKRSYLKDLPLVFGYVLEAARAYPEFSALAAFLASLEPRFHEAQARESA